MICIPSSYPTASGCSRAGLNLSPALSELLKAWIDLAWMSWCFNLMPSPLSKALVASAMRPALLRMSSVALSGPLMGEWYSGCDPKIHGEF